MGVGLTMKYGSTRAVMGTHSTMNRNFYYGKEHCLKSCAVGVVDKKCVGHRDFYTKYSGVTVKKAQLLQFVHNASIPLPAGILDLPLRHHICIIKRKNNQRREQLLTVTVLSSG